MTTEAAKAAKAKYDAKTARYVSLKLNSNTDREIIEHLSRQENIQGYLKKLIREDIKGGEKTMKISFEAGEGRNFSGGVNFMKSADGTIYAECKVPEGASDDYGYLAMKNAILAKTGDHGLEFWYDGQESHLEPDASADCEIYLDIDHPWYAVQRDREDDWSTGSYDKDEAIAMAKRQQADYPDTLIAVIDNSTENAVCIDEITEF